MRRRLLTVSLCTAVVLYISGSAVAGLTNLRIGGDRVVYGCTDDLYWHPLPTNTTRMTESEQQSFIDQLNAEAHGKIQTWEFASLGHTVALGSSASQGPTAVGMAASGAWSCSPVHLEKYLMPAEFADSPAGLIFPTIGPKVDEMGVLEGPGRTLELGFGKGGHHFVALPNPGTGIFDVIAFGNDLSHVGDNDLFVDSGWFGSDEYRVWIVSDSIPVPTPGALILGSIGVGLVSWLRRYRTL